MLTMNLSTREAGRASKPRKSNTTNNNPLRDEKKEDDKEEEKLQDALSSAIVKEKPNIKWSDVAGLDQAKASL